METANKENLTHEKACCPFCGSKDIWATVLTTITCSKKQLAYIDGIDDDEGNTNWGAKTLREIIESTFGEITSCVCYITRFNCNNCGKKWSAEFGEYRWVKGDTGYTRL